MIVPSPRESRAKREGKQPIVYRYEIRGDLPTQAVEELHRAHKLRNKLVEIEHAHDAAIAAVWAAYPVTAPLAATVEAISQECGELAAQIQEARKRQRTRMPDAQGAAALKDARARLRDARDAFKAAKAAERPQVRGALRAADAQARAAVKATYTEAVAEGLYWGTINDVTQKMKVAAQRVITLRTQGRSAQLRFRRWDGTGTLAVQLQRKAADPPRTPEVLASGAGKWRQQAIFTPGPRKDARLRLRIGSAAHATHIELPVIMHRALPPDADIIDVRLTRRRTGATFRAHVALTCLTPAPAAPAEGRLVAAHIGWRALPDGAIRAAVMTTPPGRVPPGAEEAIRVHDGWAELVIPARLAGQRDKLEAIQARRSLHLEGLRGTLLGWLASHPGARRWLDPEGTLGQWRSPARFAALTWKVRREGALALAACGEHPAEAAGLATRLEAWRRQDRHLWQWAAHATDKINRWRRDCWRQAAVWLLQEAAGVVVDDWALPPMLRRADVAEEEDRQAEAARANARLTAPGEFRAAVTMAAGRRGIRVAAPPGPVKGEMRYGTHHGCGGILDAGDRVASVLVPCRGCGKMVDQDVNVLRILVGSATGRAVA